MKRQNFEALLEQFHEEFTTLCTKYDFDASYIVLFTDDTGQPFLYGGGDSHLSHVMENALNECYPTQAAPPATKTN